MSTRPPRTIPNRYRYGDGWEEMRIVTETVKVKGAPDQTP